MLSVPSIDFRVMFALLEQAIFLHAHTRVMWAVANIDVRLLCFLCNIYVWVWTSMLLSVPSTDFFG